MKKSPLPVAENIFKILNFLFNFCQFLQFKIIFLSNFIEVHSLKFFRCWIFFSIFELFSHILNFFSIFDHFIKFWTFSQILNFFSNFELFFLNLLKIKCKKWSILQEKITNQRLQIGLFPRKRHKNPIKSWKKSF